MKDGAQEILGKTISGVAIKRGKDRPPASQLFLTFSDGTYFEFYSDGMIVPSGGTDQQAPRFVPMDEWIQIYRNSPRPTRKVVSTVWNCSIVDL